MKLIEACDGVRAGVISDYLKHGFNLTHTIHMIGYAERADINESRRKEELVRIIGELEIVYEECRDKIFEYLRKEAERIIECARRDVEEEKYWAAIMDVFDIENIILQEHLPKFPCLDASVPIHFLLARKIIRGMGSDIKVESNEPENHADWWKK